MSFRHGYQQGAIEVFCAIERFLDPTTREVLQAWIEKDVSMWRAKAMLGHPPNWRLKCLARVGLPVRRINDPCSPGRSYLGRGYCFAPCLPLPAD